MNKVRLSTKRKTVRKCQMELTELKNTIIGLKNSVEGFNSGLD